MTIATPRAALSAAVVATLNGACGNPSPLGMVAPKVELGTLLNDLIARIAALEGEIGSAGALTVDTIGEATAGVGVLVDGLLIKDERLQPVGSGIATGDAGVTLKDNLASAWDVKEGSSVYQAFRTTDGSEAIVNSKRLVVTDGVTSGTERIVGGLVFRNVAASTAITGATEAETIFDQNYTLPANSFKAGTVVHVRGWGKYTATTGAETHSILLKIGSVTLVTLALVDPANNDYFFVDATVICYDVGATGHIVAHGTELAQGATQVGTAKSWALDSTVIDTTVANIIGVYIDRQGTATDSDSARLDGITVEVVG